MSRAEVLRRVLETAQLVQGAELDPEAPMLQAGMDSLATVELSQRLGQTLGVALPATLVFDYPSVAAIAAYVDAKLRAADEGTGDGRGGAGGSCDTTRHTLGSSLDSFAHSPSEAPPLVALIATHLRLGAMPETSSEQPWRAVNPRACMVNPLDRWDADGPRIHPVPGSRFACYLSQADLFDPAAFSVSSGEAMFMDPQQRLMLEVGRGGGGVAPWSAADWSVIADFHLQIGVLCTNRQVVAA